MVEVDETGKTIFRFCHKTQGPVFLAGDFCQWQTDHLPMRRVGESEWLLMLRLPPGTYEFRYFADGRWFTDFAAFGVTITVPANTTLCCGFRRCGRPCMWLCRCGEDLGPASGRLGLTAPPAPLR